MRDFTSELFRREIPRPIHPRPHGRAALVAAGPCAGPAWTSRAEGGAGTSRADAPRIAPAELFRREIPRLLHLGDTGWPRLSRPGPAWAHILPATARPTSHPRPGAWRPNASGPVRWPRREGRNLVRPSTQARRRPGRHGGPGGGQPPLRAHGAHGVRFQCVIKSHPWPES